MVVFGVGLGSCFSMTGVGVGFGVGVGRGVRFGVGVGVGLGGPFGVGLTRGVGEGRGVPTGRGVPVGDGVGVAVLNGCDVGEGVGFGVGLTRGVGEGRGVPTGRAVAVGDGVGVALWIGWDVGEGNGFGVGVGRIPGPSGPGPGPVGGRVTGPCGGTGGGPCGGAVAGPWGAEGGGLLGVRGGGRCSATAMINGWLGNGRKSTINGWVRINSLRSMYTGIGSVVAPAGTSSICPARTLRNWPGLFVKKSRELPSSVINRLEPSGPASKITVVPVMATVTVLFLMAPPPEFFGTRNRIEPLSRFAVRPASLKLKIVLAPRRVMVRSAKVSSDRDSSPVRTAVSSATLSLMSASRGSA